MSKARHKEPEIWLTEQGVLFYKGGEALPPGKNRKRAEAIMNAYVKHSYQLTDAHAEHLKDKITRFFYYQVRGEPAVWDSGLLETQAPLPEGGIKRAEPNAPREIFRIYKQKTTG